MAASLMALLGCGTADSGGAPSANYLSIPTAGYHVSTPDKAAFQPGLSTVDLRAKVAMTDWTPAGNAFMLAKWGAVTEYGMFVSAGGNLNGAWNNAAGVGQFCVSTVATGVTDGATKWIRALLAPAAGTCDFFLSDDGSAWAALGTQVTGKTTTAIIVPGTPAALRAGETEAGAGQWAGASSKIFRVQMLINSVLVSDMDFSLQTLGANNTTFVATTGETWTIANSAVIANT
jgi:hypothetical protein